jgi:antitoxin MazE
MKTRIVRIGNSQGIRIPKALIEEAGLSGEVEICVQDASLVIKPVVKPRARAGWATAFESMVMHGDDTPIDQESPTSNSWDESEWKW